MYDPSRAAPPHDAAPCNRPCVQFDDGAYRALQPALNACTTAAKISDFGMSTCMRRDRSHASNVRQGTPFYTAPEVLRHQQLRQASDVYSFGVIMWELMAGRSVFALRCASSHAHRAALRCAALCCPVHLAGWPGCVGAMAHRATCRLLLTFSRASSLRMHAHACAVAGPGCHAA